MEEFGLNPIDDQIVIEVIPPDEVTKSGIVLTTSKKERVQKAKVLATGRGKYLQSGAFLENTIRINDVILFDGTCGEDTVIDGRKVRILRESNVYARLVTCPPHETATCTSYETAVNTAEHFREIWFKNNPHLVGICPLFENGEGVIEMGWKTEFMTMRDRWVSAVDSKGKSITQMVKLKHRVCGEIVPQPLKDGD